MKTPAKFCCQAILAALSLSGFSVVAAAPVITKVASSISQVAARGWVLVTRMTSSEIA